MKRFVIVVLSSAAVLMLFQFVTDHRQVAKGQTQPARWNGTDTFLDLMFFSHRSANACFIIGRQNLNHANAQ